MAMQATHVRFALEFEQALDIKDRAEYLSGVMYPDSRYVTGIDRTRTHDYSVEPKDLLAGSDFEKGWKIHVIYDKLQSTCLYHVFRIDPVDRMCSPEWFQITAAKLIENMHICESMKGSMEVMTCKYPMHCPNNEELAGVREWFELNVRVYQKGGVKLGDYRPIFDYYKESRPEITKGMLEQYHVQIKDKKLVEKILDVYDQIKQQVHEGLQS